MFTHLWRLDPEITYLNHGSFGACPRAALDAQTRFRDELEAEAIRFMVRQLPDRLDAAREAVARFIGADPESLIFVRNTTEGVNMILQRIALEPGDQLLTTDHAYSSCKRALDWVAEQRGAEVVVAKVPFPLEDPEQVTAAIVSAATKRTKLALVDHITSPTGLVFPIETIVPALQDRGIDVLVDGAHAPGMVPLAIEKLGAAYFVGNCHKWLCTPKGVAIVCVRKDRRQGLKPLVISQGASVKRKDQSAFHRDHDWTGTFDPSAVLTLPVVIEHLGASVPGGWPQIMSKNRALAIEGRKILLDKLGLPPPAPEVMIGSMAAIPLADRKPTEGEGETPMDPLADVLFHQHQIEVPIPNWPAPPKRLIRISAQLYNRPEHYVALAGVLEGLGFASG